MGVYHGKSSELSAIINDLRAKYGGNDYNLLTRNCNTFADEFLQRLLGKESPPYVNRMASIGSFFSCLLPDSVTGKAPVTNGDGGSGTMIKAKPFVGTTGVKLGGYLM